jgi:hypothetical protein
MELFLRPWGNALSDVFRPFATAALDMAKNFNDIASSDGLGVALATVSADAATSLGTGLVNAFGNIASGEGTLADFLFAGAGTVGLAKLVTSTSIGSLLTSTGIGSLLTSTSIGGLLTAVSAGTLVTGAVAAGALIVGTVAAAELIDPILPESPDEPPSETNQAQQMLERAMRATATREQAFQSALTTARGNPDISRQDVIAAYRQEFGESPPGVETQRPGDLPGNNPRTGPDAGPPSGRETEDLAEEQRAARQVLENIEENTSDDGEDGGLGDLTSGQLENLLPESAGQKYDPFN